MDIERIMEGVVAIMVISLALGIGFIAGYTFRDNVSRRRRRERRQERADHEGL